MDDDPRDDHGRHSSTAAAPDESRERRLAAALRDNLRKRKAQVRARTPAAQPPAPAAGAAGRGDVGDDD